MKKNYIRLTACLFFVFCLKAFGQNNKQQFIDEILMNNSNTKNQKFSLKKISESIDGQDQWQIIEYRQFYDNIPIAFEKIKAISKPSSLTKYIGTPIEIPQGFNSKASISEATAQMGILSILKDELVLEAKDISILKTSKAIKSEGLMILPFIQKINNAPRLVYKFKINLNYPIYRANIYIDAHNGMAVLIDKKSVHVDIPASGPSLYNGAVGFTAEDTGSQFRLRQSGRGNGIQVLSLNGGFSLNNASDITSTSNYFGNPVGVQAMWGAEKTFDYYEQEHNWNSYDNNNGLLKSYVDYGLSQNNAFWVGDAMVFGNGDGSTYSSFVALDITGHEFTHGVIQNSADLIYMNEHGALNESFADIFGEMVEFFGSGNLDWLVGEDVRIGNGAALRSFSDPNSLNMPDTYAGNHWVTGTFDNGGVHFNSSVQNYWFYLLAQGGVGVNDNGDSYAVDAIGIEKAAKIAFRNLTFYLSPNSQYVDARNYSIQAAIDLYGADSFEEISVTNAWHAVGVGPAYGQSGNNLSCANGTLTFSVTLDDHPEDLVFLVIDDQGSVVAATAPFTQNPYTTVSFPINIPPGDYVFMAVDRAGNGLGSSGSYELGYSGGVLASGSNFTYTEATQFCVGGTSGNILDTRKPTNPTNLGVTNIMETSATLSWDASTDNEGIGFYYIMENENILSHIDISTTNSYDLMNLTPGTTYTFRVLARDTNINMSEETSNIITFTTPQSVTCSTTTDVNLNIDFDGNPEQVAWYVRDASNAIVANSGGQYINQPPNTSISESINGLPDGDYLLVLFDNGGTGTWNYSLTDGNNNTIINAVSFQYSQSFQFCIGTSNGNVLDTQRPTAPLNVSVSNITSDANTFTSAVDLSWGVPTDNVGLVDYVLILNGEIFANFYHANIPIPLNLPIFEPSKTYSLKMAVTDTSGNFSPVSNEVIFTTPDITSTIHEGYFESGWNDWVDGGNDCKRYNENNNNNPTSWSYEGARSIRLRDNSGVASSMTLPGVNVFNYQSVTLNFYAYFHSFENAEDFFVLYNDGTNWINVATFVNDVDFTDGAFYNITVSLNAVDYNFVPNAQFRIQCDASGNQDQVYVDQTSVRVTTANHPTSAQIQQVSAPANISIPIESRMLTTGDSFSSFDLEGVMLYPNPATTHFNIKVADNRIIDAIKIYDIRGSLVKTYQQTTNCDIANLKAGIYFVNVYSEDELSIIKLVKR